MENRSVKSAQMALDVSEPLSIGAAAKATGLPTKTVRYYAEVGLVIPSMRAENGYRYYAPPELERLRFVRSARSFGFSLDACRELLSLYEDRGRTSRDVKEIALRRISEIEEKMHALEKLHNDLSSLASRCRGDHQPECPILSSFALESTNKDDVRAAAKRD